VLGVAGHAVPAFWFGLLFILILSVQFRLFPVGGMLTVGKDAFDVPDRLAHLVGPVLTLSLAGIANYSRYMRTETLEVLSQDYIRTARAKGLRENLVLFVHALRNSLLPLVTALGTQIAFLLSGAIVTEQVFAWPGMGRMTFEAVRSKDYPIVMAVVVISSMMLLANNFFHYGFTRQDLLNGYTKPTLADPAFWFGSDDIGRSQIVRLLYGARVSLSVAIGAAVINLTIGLVLGLMAGFLRGWVDDV